MLPSAFHYSATAKRRSKETQRMLLAKHRVGKKKKKKEEEKKKLRYDCSEGKVFAIIVTMMTTVQS